MRSAVPGDEFAVATVHVRSWQAAYRGLLPTDHLDQLAPADRAARYTFAEAGAGKPLTLLAVDGEDICGFATTGPCRDADKPGAGELYALYVHPDRWGRGIGRELIEAARSRLRAQGFSEAVLWVLAGNDRAQRFYRIDGWNADGASRLEEVLGVAVDEIRYARPLA